MLPEFNPGNYVHCGEGYQYSKIQIISNDNCIIVDGIGKGGIMKIHEWLEMNEEIKGTIQNSTVANACKGCSLGHTACYDEDCYYRNYKIKNIEEYDSDSSQSVNWKDTVTIRTPISIELCYEENAPVSDIPKPKPKSRRGTMPPSCERYIADSPTETSEVVIPKPMKKALQRKKPWYYIFICGLLD